MTTPETPKDFPYNDEFFLDQSDQDEAKKEFSKVWFALHSVAIRDEFVKHDEEARALKRRFQRWGFGVVTLAVLALSLAAFEPTFLHPAPAFMPKHTAESVAAIAGLAGIASVLMGFFGMGFSGRKIRWLRIRLLCEAIRQWRWQYFCANIPEILAASGNSERETACGVRRDQEFSRFVKEFQTSDESRLKTILDAKEARQDDFWYQMSFKDSVLRNETRAALDTTPKDESDAASQVILAYGKVRIGAQKRYSQYLVTDSGPFTTHPLTQRTRLHRWGIGLLFAIFGIHIFILLATIGALCVTVPDVVLKAVHVTAVVLALSALGLRAVEDGLRPAEHLGRFRGYLAEVRSIEDAFGKAELGTTRRNLMIALEKAAYTEMFDFLQAGNRSRYVM